MNFIEKLIFPIYTVYRNKRDFVPQGASNASKAFMVILLSLALNFCFDMICLFAIDKKSYLRFYNIFNYKAYLWIAISILLSYFFASTTNWECAYKDEKASASQVIITIGILLCALLGNAFIEVFTQDAFGK